MFSRHRFLQGAVAAGLGGLVLPKLANQHSLSEPGTPASHPSNAIIFETVRTDGLAHLSYLIGDRSSGRAAVIDPRRDVDVYLELARQHCLTITHAVETHIHADFVSGSRELAARTGTARVHVSVEGGTHYGFAHEPLRDGSRVELGAVTLTAVHTPGHTPEHMAYLATEKGKPLGFFSGDFLFADSVGRPDLPAPPRRPDWPGRCSARSGPPWRRCRTPYRCIPPTAGPAPPAAPTSATGNRPSATSAGTTRRSSSPTSPRSSTGCCARAPHAALLPPDEADQRPGAGGPRWSARGRVVGAGGVPAAANGGRGSADRQPADAGLRRGPH